jgi:hypothetical protein
VTSNEFNFLPLCLAVFSKHVGSRNSKDAAPQIDKKRGAIPEARVVVLILKSPPQRNGES